MTDGQIFGALWGPGAIIFGTCFIVFRRQISAMARAQRSRSGRRLGPNVQSPTVQAIGGAFFVLVGIGVTIGALTGVLR